MDPDEDNPHEDLSDISYRMMGSKHPYENSWGNPVPPAHGFPTFPPREPAYSGYPRYPSHLPAREPVFTGYPSHHSVKEPAFSGYPSHHPAREPVVSGHSTYPPVEYGPYSGYSPAAAPMYPYLSPTAPPVDGNTVSVAPNGADGSYPQIGFNPSLLPAAQSYTECPICFEILMAPIYQCSNGHVVCNQCVDKVDFCSQCRVPLTNPKIRNVALEQICQSLEVKCPNNLDGCEVVTMVEHLKLHMETCEYRAISLCSKHLGWAECSTKVTSSTVLSHLLEVHNVKEMHEPKFNLKLIAPKASFTNFNKGISWSPIAVTSAFDLDLLFKSTISPQGQLIVAGYLFGGTDANFKKYRIKIQLHSAAKKSRIEWTGCLISYRDQDESVPVPNVNTFQIPVDSLKEYITPFHSEDDSRPGEHSKLKLKVAFWKHSDEEAAYKTCFCNAETNEKIPLDKITLFNKGPGEADHFYSDSVTATFSEEFLKGYDHFPSELSLSSSITTICSHCRRAIPGVIYQCLQCPPPTYFCPHCIEVDRIHDQHLAIRISTADKIPLAAVVRECTSGEI